MKKLILLLALTACVTPGPMTTDPSPTPTPIAGPTPYPVGSSTPKVPTTCSMSKPQFTVVLRNAVNLAKKAVPQILSDKDGNPGDSYVLKARDWNRWYGSVINQLKDLGVDAIIDDCGGTQGCGELALKSNSVPQGTGISDQYQLLYSTGEIPLETFRYRASCIPSWFSSWP